MISNLSFIYVLAFFFSLAGQMSLDFSVSNDVEDEYRKDYGLGMIYNKDFEGKETTVFPRKKIKMYIKPEGKHIGYLYLDNYYLRLDLFDSDSIVTYNTYEYTISEEYKQNKYSKPIELNEIGYSLAVISYYKEKSGFIQILGGDHKGIWLSIDELKSHGNYETMTWIDFMKHKKGMFLPWVNEGINLRTGPGINNDKVLTLKGTQYEIRLTGKSKGKWVEVNVDEYSSEYCDFPHELVKQYEGWIKAIDDDGSFNIWFYSRGC